MMSRVYSMVAFLTMCGAGLDAQTVTATVAAGSAPNAVAANPVTNRIYVANRISSTVTVIDGANNSTTSVAVSGSPLVLAVNPVTNKIYVGTQGAAMPITVIDGVTNSTTALSLSGTTDVFALAVNPVTNKIYATSQGNTITVIDGATNTTTAVAIGGGSIALAVNPLTNQVYVADNTNNNVTIIDGATNNTEIVPAGTNPSAVAINPATNRIYILNSQSSSVTVINGDTNATTTVPLGNSAYAMAVNSVTNKVYVACSASLVVIDGATNNTTTVALSYIFPSAVAVNPTTNKIYVALGNGTVEVIDGATHATTMLTAGTSPEALAVNPATNKTYVANANSNNVSVIDGATNTTAAVPVGSNPLAVGVNPATNTMYVLNSNSANVSVINGVTNATTMVAAGTSPVAVAVNPMTNQSYVVNQISNNVTVINGATNSTSTVTVGSAPNAVTLNPVTNKIFVTNLNSNSLTVIDGASNSTIAVAVGANPEAVGVNPVTNNIYVANAGDNTVTVMNGTTNSVTATVTVGARPNAVAVNPVTNKVYVANTSSNNVTVIDGATNSTTTVAVGSAPFALALNLVSNQIYVTNSGSANVTQIDGATNNTTTIAVGSSPYAVAVNPVSNKIYVSNSGSNNVTVIDGATRTTTTVAVGNSPYYLALNPVTNTIYVPNFGSNNVTVVEEEQVQSVPLNAAITPLSGNTAPGFTPVFDYTASSSFAPNATVPDSLLFQVDTWQGPWTPASNLGAGQFSGQTASLQPGVHVLYAYATDGQEATSTITGPQSVPLIGSISAYLFLMSPEPQGVVSPSSLGFGNQAIGTTSPSQSVTLSNNGAVALNIANVAAGGDYSVSSNGCPATLAAGANCPIAVTFTPTIGGADNGTLTITDNSLNQNASTQTVSLTGTGLVPTATLSPTSLAFGNQAVGTTSTAKSTTLTNSGMATLTITSIVASQDYSISSTTCAGTLAAGANCTITVVFTPSITGSDNGAVTVTDNNQGVNGSTQTVSLTGMGTEPIATLSPGSLTFPSEPIGQTSFSQNAILSNTGSLTLTITSITASGDYSVSSTTCGATLAPNGRCQISIVFAPTIGGADNGTLTVTDNSGEVNGSTQTVSLMGTGTGPVAVLSTTTLNFGNQLIGTGTTQSVTLTNTGNLQLLMAGITASGDYSVSTRACGSFVAANAHCTIYIVFTPQVLGADNGTLTITDNSRNVKGATQTVSLTGTGAVPTAGLSPTTLSFGNQVTGTTSAAQFTTLTNSGGVGLTIASIVASHDYSISSNTCTGTLAAGANCMIGVVFAPTATGADNGTLTVTDNSQGTNGSTQTVTLTGTGTVPIAGLSPASLSFGNQAVATTSAAQSVTLSNSGTGPLTITSIVMSQGYSVTSTNCPTMLAASSSCTISVAFAPTTAGTDNGMLTVTDNSQGVNGSTQAVALTGTGVLQVTVSPSLLHFAPEKVGNTSADKTVAITNNLSTALTIGTISITGTDAGDFKIAGDTCRKRLAPAASCKIKLTFTPAATGSRTATLTVNDSANNSPQTVSLTGKGE